MSAAPQTPFGDRPELERGLLRSIHRSPAKLLDKAQRAALAEVLPWLGLDTLVLRGATKKANAAGSGGVGGGGGGGGLLGGLAGPWSDR
ncbi:MAG: hypothetical protein IPM79_30400 [Polyangiaceae bacterium]|nr:hypothetical protein [Polyangiaceae bacterium]